MRITEKFMSWSLNRKNMKDPDSLTLTEDDFYKFLIHTTKLPVETWISSDPSKPPLWDLADRVKKLVIGHDREVERIAMRIRTSLINGFSEVPFFIIMGPTGSGKDTLIKAFNHVLFGHDGRHLNFDIGGLMSKSLSKIIHGTEDRLPLLVDRMNSGKPYGIIGLNEAKDAESQGFNSLKVLIEDRVVRPIGKDSRERHLGLYPVFILGQYGEEMLEGKTEKEIDKIVDNLTEEHLIEILIEGAGSQFGQMPESLIKRAIRSGGIHFLKPVKHKHFKEIARINLNRMIDRLAKKSKIMVNVDDSILGFVSDTAILNKKDPRGLDGLLMNFVEVAISEATYKGPIPQRNVEINLSYRTEDGVILVEQVEAGKVVKQVPLNPERLSLTRCEFFLGR
jgi:ATP-dependent Clp protease ATP-binding subunit ClpA